MKGLLIFILVVLGVFAFICAVLTPAKAENHLPSLLDWEKVAIVDEGEQKILVLKNPYPAEVSFVVIAMTAQGIPWYVFVGEKGLQRFIFTGNDYTEVTFENDKEAEKIWFLLRKVGVYPM